MSILLTRPHGRNEYLAQLLDKNHLDYVITPLIEIKPYEQNPTNVADLQWADHIIFVSANAVHFALQNDYLPWKQQQSYFAIGDTTKQHLQRYRIKAQAPLAPQTSETMIDLLKENNISHHKFLIICGQQGRETLQEHIKEHDGQIKYWQVYQRQSPLLNLKKTLSFWQSKKVTTMIISSGFTLQFLQQSFKGQDWIWLKNLTYIVPSARLYQHAKQLGLSNVVQASGADDQAMLHMIHEHQLLSVTS